MKAFSPKSNPETQQANEERKRLTSRVGLSAEAAASRASGFVDHRPEAIAQRKLKALMDQSPQVRRQAHLQPMIDNHPRQVAQRQELERMFGPAVHRQEWVDVEELQMQAEPGTLQRQSLEGEELLQGKMEPVQRQEELEDGELLQGKFDPVQRQGLEDEELVQGKFATRETPTQFEGDPGQQDNRTGMPDNLKAGIENLSGMSMDNVKVHYNSSKPAQLNALAYTQGTNIHVGPGQEQHLPHEGWHVVQQMQGRVKPTLQGKGVAINDDGSLEHEADVMGAKAMAGAKVLQVRRSEKGGLEFPVRGRLAAAQPGAKPVVQAVLQIGGAATTPAAVTPLLAALPVGGGLVALPAPAVLAQILTAWHTSPLIHNFQPAHGHAALWILHRAIGRAAGMPALVAGAAAGGGGIGAALPAPPPLYFRARELRVPYSGAWSTTNPLF